MCSGDVGMLCVVGGAGGPARACVCVCVCIRVCVCVCLSVELWLGASLSWPCPLLNLLLSQIHIRNEVLIASCHKRVQTKVYSGLKLYTHVYTHTYIWQTCRVGQNHICTVYIRYFWHGNYEKYGHIRCIYTVLANPTNMTYMTCIL